MKFRAILFLIFVFEFGFSQNQKFVSLKLDKEYQNKQITINAKNGDVFYFQSNVLIKKIQKGTTDKILVNKPNSFLYSSHTLSKNDLFYQGKEVYNSFLESRNTPLYKTPRIDTILSIWLLLVLILLSFIRTKSIDVFFGFVVPWIAYSNTEEIVEKMNINKMLLPISLLLLNSFALVWMFNPTYDWWKLSFCFLLLTGVLIFKILILNVLEYLFDVNGFARKHLLEFLKFSIVLSLLLFSFRFLEILNHWEFVMVYRIGVLLYILLWFVSITFSFYKDSGQKIIHFFSYLCISEAIPVLIAIALWKN